MGLRIPVLSSETEEPGLVSFRISCEVGLTSPDWKLSFYRLYPTGDCYGYAPSDQLRSWQHL